MFRVTDPTRIELKLYISVVSVFGASVVWQLAIHMPSLEDIVLLLRHGICKIAKSLAHLFLSARGKAIWAYKKVGGKLEKTKDHLKDKFRFVLVCIRDLIIEPPPHGTNAV